MCHAFHDGRRGGGDGRGSRGYSVCRNKSLAKVVVEALGDSLPTKDLGEVKFFLGCEFIRDREAGTIEIT